MIVHLLIIVVLTIVNGLFAMGELALVSSRRVQLKVLQQKGIRRADRAIRLIELPQNFLPTAQVGITLVSILEGVYGGARIQEDFAVWLDRWSLLRPISHELSMAIVVLFITGFMLILGELIPKKIALYSPERIAIALALPFQLMAIAVMPLVWVLDRSSSLFLRLVGIRTMARLSLTEEEIRVYMAEAEQAGDLAAEERSMIDRLMRLADRSVRAVMTPRNVIDWVEKDARRDDIIRTIRRTRHMHLVVCEDGIDNPVGVVHVKDLLNQFLEKRKISVAAALKMSIAVPDTVSILDVLEKLRDESLDILMVLDEYGSFEGVVTSQDVFEAIVGDPNNLSTPVRGKKDSRHSILLDGSISIDEIKDQLGLEKLPTERTYHTVGGLILARLKRLPTVGDKVVVENRVFEVVSVKRRRITKVKVSLLLPTSLSSFYQREYNKNKDS